jgi:hypothetical protein
MEAAKAVMNVEDFMTQTKAENMVARLLCNAADLQYGAVTVTAKVYNGQVTQVMYSTTENVKDTSQQEENE